MSATCTIHVNIGEAHAGRAPDLLRTTLGSCVGIAMWWPEGKVFGLGHALLPDSATGGHKQMYTARYADTAVHLVLRRMRVPSTQQPEVQAMLFGGANMFSARARRMAADVGARNIEVATETIAHCGVQLVMVDVGGAPRALGRGGLRYRPGGLLVRAASGESVGSEDRGRRDLRSVQWGAR